MLTVRIIFLHIVTATRRGTVVGKIMGSGHKKPWDVVHHHGFTRHTASCMCVGCHHLPKSLSYLNSLGSFRCRLPATQII
ncbi:hypothetical protein GCT62_13520 [Yersinia enterocolitica]|nr:hypothetical protein [Yersinia enterocolitica]